VRSVLVVMVLPQEFVAWMGRSCIVRAEPMRAIASRRIARAARVPQFSPAFLQVLPYCLGACLRNASGWVHQAVVNQGKQVGLARLCYKSN